MEVRRILLELVSRQATWIGSAARSAASTRTTRPRPAPSTTSRSRTSGPVVDRVTETEVRRVNVIVYANYGETNARIIHGRDYDFPDLRTHEHNETIQGRIPELAAAAREVIEEKERKQVARIKGLIREYHRTKTDKAKREFEEANGLFPFLFSRAWSELKREKAAADPALAAASPDSAVPEDVLYPLDAALRERVIDIESLIHAIGEDLERLKAAGKADDILIQTCRKLTRRAREALAGPPGLGVHRPPPRHDPEQPHHDLAADPGPLQVVRQGRLRGHFWHSSC